MAFLFLGLPRNNILLVEPFSMFRFAGWRMEQHTGFIVWLETGETNPLSVNGEPDPLNTYSTIRFGSWRMQVKLTCDHDLSQD